MWYDGGRVFAEATCFYGLTIPLIQVDRPIVKTVSGSRQWVAMQVNLINESGVHRSDWWYGEAAQWGDFYLQAGNWRFQNARTGARRWELSLLHELGVVRGWIQVQVAWYGSSGIVRQTSFILHPDDYTGC